MEECQSYPGGGFSVVVNKERPPIWRMSDFPAFRKESLLNFRWLGQVTEMQVNNSSWSKLQSRSSVQLFRVYSCTSPNEYERYATTPEPTYLFSLQIFSIKLSVIFFCFYRLI